MDENEFIFKETTFTAVNAKPFFGCAQCSFYLHPCTNLINHNVIPPCQDWKRLDGHDVIFVEKQP